MSDFHKDSFLEFAPPVEFGGPTTPILETTSPDLSNAEIQEIITQSRTFIDSAINEEIKASYLMEWLTYALYSSVKMRQESTVRDICSIVFKLAEKDIDTLSTLLEKNFEVGPFKGQALLFVWMNALYSSTFDARTYTNIVAINYIFAYVIEHTTLEFSSALTKAVEEGQEQGKSPFILMLLSLIQAAQTRFNHPATTHIAKFLLFCMGKSPEATSQVLIQPIAAGAFHNKHGLYLLANALKFSVKDNSETSQIICKVLGDMVHYVAADSLANALLAKIARGPQEGLVPLHIILRSLTSAAYVNDSNHETIKAVIDMLEQFFNIIPLPTIIHALSEEIVSKDHTYGGKHGIRMLVEAFIAGMEHGHDMSALMALFSKLINSNPALLMNALTREINEKPSCLEYIIRKYNEAAESTTLSVQIGELLRKIDESLSLDEKVLWNAHVTKIYASLMPAATEVSTEVAAGTEASAAAIDTTETPSHYTKARFFSTVHSTALMAREHDQEDNPTPPSRLH
ncbi:hypothetical protein [Legionella oakridgensis]|uniref:hypothetical protein n=1 Tax=Legionella oakridgensis TaxID=29423 RepID=UPI0003DE4FB4|nr:hypothetical protein [Legionella oakridgensis]ETO93049.1 hypothetical protein LOR_75c21480 [Legionella oakridgensis RV-2-2007]